MNLLIRFFCCRKKSDCPLEGKCLQTNVIYQATVTTETATETYVGLATNFKERYRNHKTSFRHSKRRNETQLSKYVWNLQNEKKPFQIKWKILKKCKPYSNVSKKCSLCLNEKFIIICKKELCSLNTIVLNNDGAVITTMLTCILPLLFKFEFCNEHAADVFKPKRLQFIWNLTDEWISSLLVYETDLY